MAQSERQAEGDRDVRDLAVLARAEVDRDALVASVEASGERTQREVHPAAEVEAEAVVVDRRRDAALLARELDARVAQPTGEVGADGTRAGRKPEHGVRVDPEVGQVGVTQAGVILGVERGITELAPKAHGTQRNAEVDGTSHGVACLHAIPGITARKSGTGENGKLERITDLRPSHAQRRDRGQREQHGCADSHVVLQVLVTCEGSDEPSITTSAHEYRNLIAGPAYVILPRVRAQTDRAGSSERRAFSPAKLHR